MIVVVIFFTSDRIGDISTPDDIITSVTFATTLKVKLSILATDPESITVTFLTIFNSNWGIRDAYGFTFWGSSDIDITICEIMIIVNFNKTIQTTIRGFLIFQTLIFTIERNSRSKLVINGIGSKKVWDRTVWCGPKSKNFCRSGPRVQNFLKMNQTT